MLPPSRSSSWVSLLLLLSFAHCRLIAAEKPGADVTVAVLAADFEFQGDWDLLNDLKQPVLIAAQHGRGHAAATAVQIPRPSRYRLWVCTRDWPEDRPGTRTFAVRVGERRAEKTFGASGKEGYAWEDGGWFDVREGPLLLCLENPRPFARVQGLLLTTDPHLQPVKLVGQSGFKPVQPLTLGERSDDDAGEFKVTADRPMASLANEHVRIEFLPARRDGQPTVAVRALVKSGSDWVNAGTDPAAEGYFVVRADAAATVRHAGFYPSWTREPDLKPVTVKAGDASVQTISGKTTRALWRAGSLQRLKPRQAFQKGGGVRIDFYPSALGQPEALWQLAPEQRAAAVTLTLMPSVDGQLALGYKLFFRRDLENVSELLLPMMWQRHRLPPQPTTLLDNCTPTPLALAQPQGEPATVFAVMGEPADLPFEWPDGRRPHFGLSIANGARQVQPSIWGPVIGTPAAVAKSGQPMRLRFRVLVQAGDWYTGYRATADEVFRVHDYRSNVRVSLTDAALNMIDLLMDDVAGGWWDRARAFYQIETKNGSTHASPMLLLSLYRLTGDAQVYRRRALPAMEFLLSRDGPHFSPIPQDTGPAYPVAR